MKNKKKILIGIIIVIVLLGLCAVVYKYRLSDLSGGMKVTMLGGSTMKDKGDINSMRLHYKNS